MLRKAFVNLKHCSSKMWSLKHMPQLVVFSELMKRDKVTLKNVCEFHFEARI